MPKLKKFKLQYDCDNLLFEFNLLNYKPDKQDGLEWIPYEMKLIVENEEYVIDEFSMHRKNVEQWIDVMQSLIDERKNCTYYDTETGKSVSTVPNTQRSQVRYQEFDCYLGEELEFEIKMENLEDFWDDIIVDFTIWMKSACIKNRKQGYSIGYNFAVKYDDIREFCHSLNMQYEKYIEDAKSETEL